jgi:hypothetical protein
MNQIEKSKPINPSSVLMGFNNPQSQISPGQNQADNDCSPSLNDLINQNYKVPSA